MTMGDDNTSTPTTTTAPVLITGATGFVGSRIARECLAAGDRVRVLARPTSDRKTLLGLDVDIVEGDLGDADSLRAAVRGCRGVYHVAAMYKIFGRERDFVDANVLGTRNLLRAAAAEGVERVVYTSTVGAVGSLPKGASADATVDEDNVWNFGGMGIPYMTTKYLAEVEAIRAAAAGLPIVTVNPSGPIGAWDVKPTPTGEFVLSLLRGRPFVALPGKISYVDAGDVARAHRLAMLKGTPGDRYIVAGPALSMRDMAAILDRVTVDNVRTPPTLPRWMFRTMIASRYVAPGFMFRLLQQATFLLARMDFDSSKAERELGLTFTPIEKSFAEAVRWFAEHGYTKARPRYDDGGDEIDDDANKPEGSDETTTDDESETTAGEKSTTTGGES